MSPRKTTSNLGDLEDWRLWCRLCAKKDPQGNINVFFKDETQLQPVGGDCGTEGLANSDNSSLAAAIERFFGVNIDLISKLPRMLCTECFSLMTSLVNFSERVSKVQQMFEDLEKSVESTNLDLHDMRLKYGLLDEDREHVLENQTVKEVLFFEGNSKINELDDHSLEADDDESNPLEQPRIEVKIKEENSPARSNNGSLEKTNENKEYEDNENESFEKYNVDESSEDKSPPLNTEMEVDAKREKKNNKQKIAKRSGNVASSKDGKTESPMKRRKYKEPSINEMEVAAKQSKDLKCSQCNILCSSVSVLQKHIKYDHMNGGSFKCKECPREFPTQARLNKHAKVHLPVELKKVVPCPYCDNKFSGDWNVQLHIKHVHLNVRPFVCQECGFKVRTNGKLKEHMLKHSDYAPFECEVCKRRLKDKYRLKNHMRIHNTNKPDTLPVAPKRKRDRPWVCEECGIAVSTKLVLKEHMVRHTDDTPFECEVCKKRFKSKHRLRIHAEVHNPNKQQCPECGVQLNTREILKKHMLVHSDKMQHKCDYCGRAFKYPKALKYHLILHMGLKPYSCDFCELTFAHDSNYRTHVKKSHSTEFPAWEAAGGSKTCRKNVPKLAALKAIAKTANNLGPARARQSKASTDASQSSRPETSTTTTASVDSPHGI